MMKQGRPDAAAQEAAKLSRKFPRSATIWNIFGAANSELGKLDLAETGFRRSLACNPNATNVMKNLGVALIARAKNEDAIVPLRQAVALRPDFAEAHRVLGTALLHLEMFDEAETHLRRATELEPRNAQAENNLGIALQKQGKPDEAIASFARSLEIDPKQAEVLSNLGTMYRNRGRLEDAYECIVQAIVLQPDVAKLQASLASVLSSMGNSEEAISRHLKALDIDPNHSKSATYLAKFRKGLLTDQILAILEGFQALDGKPSPDGKDLVLRANLLRHRGDLDASFATLREANKIAEDAEAISAWRDECLATSDDITRWTPRQSGHPNATDYRLLFILGPSRSGKTTIETLLSKSPHVLSTREGIRKTGKEALADLTDQRADTAVKVDDLLYYTEDEILAGGFHLVINTNPFNLNVAHLIHDTFENAYFLFVERDEIRTASEIFAYDYRSGNPFAQNPTTALEHVKWYRDASRCLAGKMGSRALTVSYSDVAGGQMNLAEMVEGLVGVELFEGGSAPVQPARADVSTYEEHFRSLLQESGAG
ncbi:MAG: tetratricopeptide repeat protein [Paracoccaceae bacterium]|nr:tetratricopeptide repeat protein [Paracoccaceae bacterium]